MKRFEEIKKMRENFTCGVEEIDDLIQMVDLLIRRNSVEVGSIKKLLIIFSQLFQLHNHIMPHIISVVFYQSNNQQLV